MMGFRSLFGQLALVIALLAGVSVADVADVLAAETLYTVKPGDMLGSIAKRHNVSVEELRSWNGLRGDFIREGQKLRVGPPSGGKGSATVTKPSERSSTKPAAMSTKRAPESASASSSAMTHVVVPGDTLSGIAKRYKTTVSDLQALNRGLQPDRLRVGQELRIPGRNGRAVRKVEYEIQAGDFIGKVAQENGVTIADLKRWNNRLDPDRVRIGQKVVMYLEGPEKPSESVGKANDGRLVHGELLPRHRGYHIRNPKRAWATNQTVSAILEGFDHVIRTFPRAPRVMMADLSFEKGGPISGHKSHQSGRDADLGYYLKSCGDLCEYRHIEPRELDAEKQWALLHYWIRNELVEYVFIDYRLQKVLYEHARRKGATERELREWFQYPNGQDRARGLIRHEPNHADHIHVRFACPRSDRACR